MSDGRGEGGRGLREFWCINWKEKGSICWSRVALWYHKQACTQAVQQKAKIKNREIKTGKSRVCNQILYISILNFFFTLCILNNQYLYSIKTKNVLEHVWAAFGYKEINPKKSDCPFVSSEKAAEVVRTADSACSIMFCSIIEQTIDLCLSKNIKIKRLIYEESVLIYNTISEKISCFFLRGIRVIANTHKN